MNLPFLKTRVTDPSPGLIHGSSSQSSILDLLFDLLKVPHKTPKLSSSKSYKHKKGKNDKDEKPTSYSISHTSHKFSELFNKWTKTYSLRKLAKENSSINYSAYLLISLKLIEIFSKRNLIKNRTNFIEKLLINLSLLSKKYGITSSQEDLLLFASLILYLKSETFKTGMSLRHYIIDKKILYELKELETITISMESSSESLEFKDTILEKLAELKISLNIELSKKSIAALIASIIMVKTEQSRLSTSKKLVNTISNTKKDEDAYFLCLILEFLYLIDEKNKKKIRSKINLKRKNPHLRFFRKNLYEDVLKIGLI